MFNNLDSFACDALTHWLVGVANEEVKKKVYTTTESTSSLLECPGRMDTINLIVLFVLYAVIVFKVC